MTTPPRRRPGRPIGGAHVVDRERLLDAAEQVIAREGHRASLETIAAEAGVTKPIVYARIGSRAELSDALAERLADRLNAAAQTEVLAAASLDRSTLAALFRAILETVGASRELFLFVTRGSARDTPERTLYLAGHSAAPLAELLTHWRKRQNQDAAVAVAWAYGIVGMLNLVAMWWMEDSELPAGVVAEHLAELVWPGLYAGS